MLATIKFMTKTNDLVWGDNKPNKAKIAIYPLAPPCPTAA